MPMVSTIPAMPGSVSVAPSSDRMRDDQDDVGDERDVGDDAERAVGDQHEATTRMPAMIEAILPAAIESAPRLGPTVRSSTMVSVGGQRAGAQQDREVVGALRR